MLSYCNGMSWSEVTQVRPVAISTINLLYVTDSFSEPVEVLFHQEAAESSIME